MSLVSLPKSAVGVPRDGLDRPLVVPRKGGKAVAHTRTTTFIDCVEDKGALIDWGKKSVLEGMAADPSIAVAVLKAQEIEDPKRKRQVLMALVERALDAAGANDKREQGSYLHGLSELVDAGLPLPESVTEQDALDMAAYMMATLDFTHEHVERLVVVNELCVAGTPDRVSFYTGPGPLEGMWFDNELLITDLKSGNTEYGRLKMAAQLAAYSRGEFYDHTLFPLPELTEKQKTGDEEKDHKKRIDLFKKIEWDADLAASAYESLGEVNQDWGVIFAMPSGSGECEPMWIDLNIGWEMAKLAQTIRKGRSRRNVMRPFLAG